MLEEILTPHKLKMNDKIWRSFNTINPVENLNSQLEKYLHKVKYWKNSNMWYRWIAVGLLEIKQKMNKIFSYKKNTTFKKSNNKLY